LRGAFLFVRAATDVIARCLKALNQLSISDIDQPNSPIDLRIRMKRIT
jgi:hypothetical protein